ncbi:MAG: hypothetical protein CBE50_002925 [Flammeovirgaceae bacterium TMED290]|nr:MAG: hypothetical protein CBE50_002925 [Flammeovirgaceae bacterium TMED290]
MLKSIKIYKSSAGSGKTYTLSKNYIRLALKNKNNFRKILAVTFTNKAAEEMKSRILEMINSIYIGEDKNLIIELSKYFNISAEELSIKAKSLKTNILHNYSYFNITTIDSFFYSIIQSFTRDLKFRGKYNIEMDLEFVINEVVSSFLSDLNRGDKITKWLIDFSREKINSGKDFMINNELKNITKILFTEDYKSIAKVSSSGTYIDQIDLLRKKINSNKKRFEEEVIHLSSELMFIMKKNDLGENDFSFGYSGIFGFIQKNSKGEIKYPSKRIISCFNNPEKWVVKNYSKRDKILDIIKSNLIDDFDKLIKYYKSSFAIYNSSNEIGRNLYTYGIISELDLRIIKYRDENDVILISDISELLYQVIKDESIPFIFEKVGNSYSNYLIDEFQDTSIFQWKNFIRLINESVASGNENIFVGDSKQSIYRWRGSDSKIMDYDIESYFGSDIIEFRNLNKNWRSSEEIIKFNNSIFSRITECFEDDSIIHNLSLKFNSDIVQQIREDKMGEGYVEVNFRDNENEKLENVNSFLINSINKIQDNGYSAGDIGIIVRDNKEANIIAEMLSIQSYNDKNYNYDYVSADALDINSSPVVNFFISVFKYLKNSRDRLALSEIVHFYYFYILKSNDISHFSISNDDKLKLLPELFSENILKISRLPIYELVEELIRVFKLNTLDSQIPYLKSFQDIIIEYKVLQSEETGSFLEWWKKNGNRKLNMTQQDNEIQIITIHKSKGLEFDNVILPFFDWSLDNLGGSREKIIWVDLKKYDKDFDFIYPIKYFKSEHDSVFDEYYKNERVKSYEDNINLMYVSFTRPKDNLFILGGGEKRKNIKTVSDILLRILGPKPGSDQYVFGKIKKIKSHDKNNLNAIVKYPSYSWRKRLIIKTTEDENLNFEGKSRGDIIHQVLSQIYHLNHFDKKLAIAYDEGLINKKDLEIISSLKKNKEVIKFFDYKNKSFNEIEILSDNGNTYRLDRVVETEKEIYVLDYKTGKIVDYEHKKYLNKLDLYISLLKNIYDKPIVGHLIYVDLNKVI